MRQELGRTPGLSKQVKDLCTRAQQLGLDPTPIIDRASQAAIGDGRNKVGFFGSCKRPLETLRQNVDSTLFESHNPAFKRQ